jgi:hypothetical protein
MWRGSFNVTLKFVKTEFHSGRLQITWTPGLIVSNTPDTSTSLYSLRQIVDIREQDEITLNLPYMIGQDFISSGDGQYLYSGQLDVVVLNNLRAPETVSQTIEILEYYTAGDDFEFAAPSTASYSSTTGAVPFVPQSSEADVLVKCGIADGQVKRYDLSSAARCVGESILSVKQLLNRISQNYTSFGLSGVNTLILYPWYAGGSSIDVSTGALTVGSVLGDAFSLLAPMFVFFRGGARFTIVTDSTIHVGGFNVPGMMDALSSTDCISTAILPQGLWLGTTNPFSTSGMGPFTPVVSSDLAAGIGHFSVPYYSNMPVAPVKLFDGEHNTVYQNAPAIPRSVVGFAMPSGLSGEESIYRAMNDDLHLSYFISAPPLLFTYV